jgi:translation elongation factor P/translation initiation factor 5A
MTKQYFSLSELETILKPMAGVVSTNIDDYTALEKNDLTFCKIRDNNIYFLDEVGEFRQIDLKALVTSDNL